MTEYNNKIYTLGEEPKIGDLEVFGKFQSDIDELIIFFQQFSNLISDNGHIISFISNEVYLELNTILIDSSANTLKSIKYCCSIGCFSDANTLVRKIRDDLLLYIYLLEIINSRKVFDTNSSNNISSENTHTEIERLVEGLNTTRVNKKIKDDEKILIAWCTNTINELPNNLQRKLGFTDYMNRIKQNTLVSNIIETYDLNSYWNKLSLKLNNYVHNNGKEYTKRNIVKIGPNVKSLLEEINKNVSLVSSFFIVLIIMVDPRLISSSDLIDYLDSGQEPPDNCQYWVAPFIQEFIDNKIVKLHPEIKQYLIDKNIHGMEIK